MKNQMELTFVQSREFQARSKRQRRQLRAHWWFEQMRQVVDRALDRPPRTGRPEQIYFSMRGPQIN